MSTGCVRSLGATQGTSLRTSFEIKEAFFGGRCEPLDLFTSCEGARTGGLLSGAAPVEAEGLAGFGLRENLRLALLDDEVEVPVVVEELVVVVFGCVVEAAVMEILSLSFSV